LAPLRNVDGAVWEARRTVHAQPLSDPATVTEARGAGVRAAIAVRSRIEEER
jgi:hypothetical protein